MSILALDTSGNICQVSILTLLEMRAIQDKASLQHTGPYPHSGQNIKPLESSIKSIPRHRQDHAKQLPEKTISILGKYNLAFSDLTRIAVITGPGSFTGLRIGLSFARGLALALNIPCLGFSAFEVLAYQSQKKWIACFQDCPPSEVFFAGYLRGKPGLPPQRQPYDKAIHTLESWSKGTGISQESSPQKEVQKKSSRQKEERKKHDKEEDETLYYTGSGAFSLQLPVQQRLALTLDTDSLAQLAFCSPPDLYPPEPLYHRAVEAQKMQKEG